MSTGWDSEYGGIVESNRSRTGKVSRNTRFQANLCTVDDERYNAFVTLKPEFAEDLALHVVRIFTVKRLMNLTIHR